MCYIDVWFLTVVVIFCAITWIDRAHRRGRRDNPSLQSVGVDNICPEHGFVSNGNCCNGDGEGD